MIGWQKAKNPARSGNEPFSFAFLMGKKKSDDGSPSSAFM
jgi:hypothetical protein